MNGSKLLVFSDDRSTPITIRTRGVIRVLPFPSPRPLPRGEGEPFASAEMKLESFEFSLDALSCSLSPRERARVRGNRANFGPVGSQLKSPPPMLGFS